MSDHDARETHDIGPQDRDTVRAIIAEVVRAEISHANSARKNGEGWIEWANKPGTKQLAILLVAAASLVFNLGRDFTRYTEGVDALEKRVEIVATGQEQIRENADALLRRHDELLILVERTQADIRELNDKLALSITRQEMRSVLNQQILPRLDAIEQQLRAER